MFIYILPVNKPSADTLHEINIKHVFQGIPDQMPFIGDKVRFLSAVFCMIHTNHPVGEIPYKDIFG
jgi:hypothetical protein